MERQQGSGPTAGPRWGLYTFSPLPSSLHCRIQGGSDCCAMLYRTTAGRGTSPEQRQCKFSVITSASRGCYNRSSCNRCSQIGLCGDGLQLASTRSPQRIERSLQIRQGFWGQRALAHQGTAVGKAFLLAGPSPLPMDRRASQATFTSG
jgi:hypothetical protein